jgi:hypothetical protein
LQDFAEWAIDFEFLLDDSDKHISRNGDPDLSLDRVWRSTIECFDSKMLFDPFEKDFDLPSVFEE